VSFMVRAPGNFLFAFIASVGRMIDFSSVKDADLFL